MLLALGIVGCKDDVKEREATDLSNWHKDDGKKWGENADPSVYKNLLSNDNNKTASKEHTATFDEIAERAKSLNDSIRQEYSDTPSEK